MTNNKVNIILKNFTSTSSWILLLSLKFINTKIQLGYNIFYFNFSHIGSQTARRASGSYFSTDGVPDCGTSLPSHYVLRLKHFTAHRRVGDRFHSHPVMVHLGCQGPTRLLHASHRVHSEFVGELVIGFPNSPSAACRILTRSSTITLYHSLHHLGLQPTGRFAGTNSTGSERLVVHGH